jgi:hypothetical protein
MLLCKCCEMTLRVRMGGKVSSQGAMPQLCDASKAGAQYLLLSDVVFPPLVLDWCPSSTLQSPECTR